MAFIGFIILGGLACLIGMFAYYAFTPTGQASAQKAADEQAAKRAAHDAARTHTGPGWRLMVAGQGIIIKNRVMATTGATITNTGVDAASFAVEAVVRDADNVRLGTILAVSSRLPPGDSELLVLQGVIAPLTTRTPGRHSFEVRRY